MSTDVRSSILLAGGNAEVQSLLGADWVPSLAAAESLITQHAFGVAVLPASDSLFNELNYLLDVLKKQSPETEIIFANQGLNGANLRRLINRCHPFHVMSGYDEGQLSEIVQSALAAYRQSRQNADLLRLVHEQNERLKKINKELEEKVQKRQRYLSRAEQRLLQTNQQIEALHSALLAIHQAQSVGEMERFLNEALAKHLQLSWTRILFSSQSSLLGTDPLMAAGSIRVYKSPLHINDKKAGSICFARPVERADFSNIEIEFLNQITETVALALGRLQALEQTRSFKAQWEATFDAIAEPLCITDNDYFVIRMNRAYMESSGKSYNQLLGKDCFTALTGQSPPASVRSGESSRWEVFSTDHHDRRVWEVSQRPLNIKSRLDNGRLVLFRNITEQLSLERQVLESAKMAELGTIGSSIAHELNNPLGGIMSFLQLINMDLDPSSEIKEDVAAMEEAAKRCKEIVENLLGFARMSGEAEGQVFDLGESIQQAVRIMELQTRSQGIALNAQTPGAPAPFKGQPAQFNQALRNLLQNAIDAVVERMSQVPGFPGKIDITLEVKKNVYQIYINDNGTGIATKDQQKIFNPLYTTKSTAHNPGLGLTVAFSIITDHGGTLEITSQTGSGASARITVKRPDLKA